MPEKDGTPLPEGEGHWGPLEVPFICCASQGGPFDDLSFAVGYDMGWADHTMSEASHRGPISATLRTATIKQLDLLAMYRGWVMRSEPTEDEDWSYVTLTRGAEVEV